MLLIKSGRCDVDIKKPAQGRLFYIYGGGWSLQLTRLREILVLQSNYRETFNFSLFSDQYIDYSAVFSIGYNHVPYNL